MSLYVGSLKRTAMFCVTGGLSSSTSSSEKSSTEARAVLDEDDEDGAVDVICYLQTSGKAKTTHVVINHFKQRERRPNRVI
mmetsp:Transcript_22156/g.37472  ORF Transcript_22156/g.37472 Transcript_22156/m.37472 type:complete len:81 (+) Transcript_22156:625-867(+)